MILRAEHEMNASTFTARVVAGTNADMHSAIVAAISALKGPLHGGANRAMSMFEEFGSVDAVPEGVRGRLVEKKPLYGFGHPLYRAMDPARADPARWQAPSSPTTASPFLEIAQAAEREAHEQKGLWPSICTRACSTTISASRPTCSSRSSR